MITFSGASLRLPVRTKKRKSAARGIASALTGGVLQGNERSAYVNALTDLTFEIYEGERVALIGHNGAGKSTLLRLVSGIFSPTSGSMNVHTYATPLIDKSFIIDTDLTGYEVCRAHYMRHNARKASYSNYIDDIVDFTELGEFLEAPVSSYSDGMRTRLMFALITSFSHPLLAMDEGIAAGDRFFIEKASTRFEKFLTNTSTLILASHDEQLLHRFTQRGLVLHKGSLVFDGRLDDALEYYHASR